MARYRKSIIVGVIIGIIAYALMSGKLPVEIGEKAKARAAAKEYIELVYEKQKSIEEIKFNRKDTNYGDTWLLGVDVSFDTGLERSGSIKCRKQSGEYTAAGLDFD